METEYWTVLVIAGDWKTDFWGWTIYVLFISANMPDAFQPIEFTKLFRLLLSDNVQMH